MMAWGKVDTGGHDDFSRHGACDTLLDSNQARAKEFLQYFFDTIVSEHRYFLPAFSLLTDLDPIWTF